MVREQWLNLNGLWDYDLLTVPRPGRYDLRCRTIDTNGIAQTMPRPFPESGNNIIQRVQIVVEQ